MNTSPLSSTLTRQAACQLSWDAVVLGAGPAGVTAAAALAQAGHAVLLVDKADFPRHKVCGGCLNQAALAALRAAGLGEGLQEGGGKADSYGFDLQRVVANALFGDGAAAVVLGQGKWEAEGHWRLLDCGSVLLPDTLEAMSWDIGDHGFEMILSPQVPSLIQAHLRPWFGPFLDHHDLDPQRIGSWAIHPGGPRVVESVLEALQLPAAAADTSREVLARCGNMSSVTTLFILEACAANGRRCPAWPWGLAPALWPRACSGPIDPMAGLVTLDAAHPRRSDDWIRLIGW